MKEVPLFARFACRSKNICFCRRLALLYYTCEKYLKVINEFVCILSAGIWCLSLYVGHKSVFYRYGWTNGAVLATKLSAAYSAQNDNKIPVSPKIMTQRRHYLLL